MEVGPSVISHELEPQPDLLQEDGNRVVTIFGITGTVAELARKCPVDLSDPRITLEDKNEFYIKVVNEAQLEVEPHRESLFRQTLERKGIEVKFTVAESKPKAQSVHLNSTGSERLNEDKAPNEARPQELERSAELVVHNQEAEQAREELRVRAAEVILPIILTVQRTEVAPELILNENDSVVKASLKVEAMKKLPALDEQVLAVEPGVITEQYVREPVTLEVTAQVVELVQPVREPTLVAQSLETAENDYAVPVFVEAAETIPTVLQAEVLDEWFSELETASHWQVELQKEAAELCTDFTEGLTAFLAVQQPIEQRSNQGGGPEVSQPTSHPLRQIAETLATLEESEQAEVGAVLLQITGAVHGLKILESRGAPAEASVAVREQLDELLLELLQTLNLPYDEATVRELAVAILRPDFLVKPIGMLHEQTADLERDGTREARFRDHWKTNFVQAASTLEKRLGRHALSLASYKNGALSTQWALAS